MAIADDFSIALNGDIRYTGTTTNYTVLELHRFLQDNADNASAATSNDLINITSDDPSARSTDNIVTLNAPYNITDTEAIHLYDGSVKQGTGATEDLYSGLVVVGNVVAGTQMVLIQNDTKLTDTWSSVPNADAANNILLRMCIKTRSAGLDIDAKKLIVTAREFNDTYSEFSLTMGEGNSVAAIFTGDDLNNNTAAGTVGTYDVHDNITPGFQAIDIDPGVSPESYYSQWQITGTGSTPASPTLESLYEYTKYITRRGTGETIHGVDGALFRGITHEIDYDGQGANPFVEDEYVCWGTTMAYDNEAGGPFTVGEKLTFGTSGAVGTLLMLQDDVAAGVLVVAIEPGTGTVVNDETITGGTSSATALVDGTTRLVDTAAVGGEGLILADDDNGATGTLWIQLVKGSAPTENLPLHGHDRTAHLAAAAVEAAAAAGIATKTVSPEFLGVYTGSAVIGAFGIGFDSTDTTSSDLFFPLEGGTATPPDNRTFNVNGLVSTEDYVIVAEDLTGGFNVAQMGLNATVSTDLTGLSLVMDAPIPDNTPAAGTIRVVDDDGTHRRITYTSWTSATFSGLGDDCNFSVGGNAAAGNDAYVTYLDKLSAATTESFNYVYVTDKTLRVRVRDGGVGKGDTPIKTAEATATMSSGAANINRISDL